MASPHNGWPWKSYSRCFFWIYKPDKTQLLFLPAHTSHVLRPLDLGVLVPLKLRYVMGAGWMNREKAAVQNTLAFNRVSTKGQ